LSSARPPFTFSRLSFIFSSPSFMFPRSSFMFPRSSFMFPHSSFMFLRSSFMFPRSSFIFLFPSFLFRYKICAYCLRDFYSSLHFLSAFFAFLVCRQACLRLFLSSLFPVCTIPRKKATSPVTFSRINLNNKSPSFPYQ
jgi:hypothetical protein